MTNCLGQASFLEAVKIAEQLGFDCLEVGPSIQRDRETFRVVQRDGPVAIHSFIYGRNFLTHHPADKQAFTAEIYQLLDLALDICVPQITMSTGVDPALSLDENITAALDFWTPLFEKGLAGGVRFALEFCPTAGNFALGPYAWRKLLAKTSQWPNFGLNYDPSHLLWQFIDPYAYITEFRDQIFSVHMKDTFIWEERLAEHGILTPYKHEEQMAHGVKEERAIWWENRLPGEGQLDMEFFLRELTLCGYQGALLLEHEDGRYLGSREAVIHGLKTGLGNVKRALKNAQG